MRLDAVIFRRPAVTCDWAEVKSGDAYLGRSKWTDKWSGVRHAAVASDLDAYLYDPPDEPWLAFSVGKRHVDLEHLCVNVGQHVTKALVRSDLLVVPLAGLRALRALAQTAGVPAPLLYTAAVGVEAGRVDRVRVAALRAAQPPLCARASWIIRTHEILPGALTRYMAWVASTEKKETA